jgi:hypothetical protein
LAFKGLKGQENETSWIVAEYNARMRLAKLGYTETIENLDCIKADMFLIIDQEIDKLEKEKNKRR